MSYTYVLVRARPHHAVDLGPVLERLRMVAFFDLLCGPYDAIIALEPDETDTAVLRHELELSELVTTTITCPAPID